MNDILFFDDSQQIQTINYYYYLYVKFTSLFADKEKRELTFVMLLISSRFLCAQN